MNKRIKIIFAFIFYFAINGLFIYKYGIRQQYVNVFYLLGFFPVFIFLILFFIKRTTFKLFYLKVIYFSIVFLFFLITIGINILVDGYSLNVDRWSAMDVSIKALIDGNYPYSAIDHLNGRSSNLPALLFIGLPFYLLGDVGFLQSFTFLFFAYFLNKTINDYKVKILGIILLIFSSFFLWEIYTKSDMMSNLILILGFIVLWHKAFKNKELEKPFLLGTIAGFMIYTRIIAIIPIVLFLFKIFISSTSKKRFLFLVSSVLTVGILTYIVFVNLPNIEILKINNPISLQNRQLPLIISFITILFPFYYSLKSKNIFDTIWFCTVFLTIPISISFLLSIIKNGMNNIIIYSTFDISYFNIMTPFLIYYITLDYERRILS